MIEGFKWKYNKLVFNFGLNMNKLILILLIIIHIVLAGKCPDEEIIAPCKCSEVFYLNK